MDIFIKASSPVLNYSQNDTILDIGCGPGYFEDQIKDKVRGVLGLDISDKYIRFCKEKFRQDKHLQFRVLSAGDNYVSEKDGMRFSKIICLSVVQYFSQVAEIEKLIRQVSQFTTPNALFLIADIPVRDNQAFACFFPLWQAIRLGYFFEQLQFMFRARFSNYYKHYREIGLLRLSIAELEDLINRMKLNAELLTVPMTIDPSRVHILIKF